MFKEKFKLFLIIIFFFSFIEKCFSIEPSIFVQSTVNRASQVLSSALSKNQKIVELKIIAKDTVDIRGIGFYSLGRYRKELNNDQKTKYAKIFEQARKKAPSVIFIDEAQSIFRRTTSTSSNTTVVDANPSGIENCEKNLNHFYPGKN